MSAVPKEKILSVEEILSEVSRIGGTRWLREGTLIAAEVIREIAAKQKIERRVKSDGSPVCEADLLSERILRDWFENGSIWPVVSEETEMPVETGPTFWLIDPLDGTREFLAGIPESTINIALVHYGEPIIGIISEPASHKLWIGASGRGVFRFHDYPLDRTPEPPHLRVAVSRFHSDPRINELFDGLSDVQFIERGSAGKFCLIADGEADLYVRMGRTMEWDTAAGHCILREVGAEILSLGNGLPLVYGKGDFANPSFVAIRSGRADIIESGIGKLRQILKQTSPSTPG